MRERWAIGLALLTGLLVILASAALAAVKNPQSAPAPAPAQSDPGRGRAVFEAQDCQRCHSVAGQGSPRSPLDDVGARYSRAELRDWVTGAEVIAEELSPRALRAKQAYATLPADDLDALLDYLAALH